MECGGLDSLDPAFPLHACDSHTHGIADLRRRTDQTHHARLRLLLPLKLHGLQARPFIPLTHRAFERISLLRVFWVPATVSASPDSAANSDLSERAITRGMCGTGTNRRRGRERQALDRLLPGFRNTDSVSAHSVISAAHQRACNRYVTKSRALIRSFHGEVCLDPDAVLAALANHKVACARLCRDKAAVGALSIFSCHRTPLAFTNLASSGATALLLSLALVALGLLRRSMPSAS